jgi:hypothetical protein
MKLGKIISHKQAAIIIGEYFPEISDKLLNTLQLESALEKSDKGQMGLLLAGISQKTKELQPISFRSAISYKSNYRYLKWLAAPTLFLIIVLLISPSFVTGPANRLVNHSDDFEKPKPYYFKIVNDSLIGIQGNDFTVELAVVGDEFPESVYLNDGKYDFRFHLNKNGILEYTFTNLKNDIFFSVFSDEIKSDQFHIKVLPRPSVSSFKVELEFPKYLRKKKEFFESTGDIVVPEGTHVKWSIFASNSSELVFFDGHRNTLNSENSENLFEFRKTIGKSFVYSIFSKSEQGLFSDTLTYAVNVIKDEKPNISIEHIQQEYLHAYAMVDGVITDDYGFSSLLFYYRLNDDQPWEIKKIKIDNNLERQRFNHTFNTAEIGLKPGDKLDFYYMVWDNDAVNGYKSSKSNMLAFSVPDEREMEQMADSTSDLMKSKYQKSLKDLDKLSEEMQKLKKDIFEKKKLDWSDKEKVKDLIKSEKELRENLMEMQNLNSKREEIREFLQNNPNESIKDKLEKLSEQIDKLQNDELLEKIEELTKNIDDLTKDQLNQLLDELKENQDDFQESLEQQLEFFKQLELEQKMSDASEKLQELAKKEKDLASETEEKENKLDEALQKQNELNKEFDNFEKQISEIDSLNSDLEKPLDLDSGIEKQDSIKQDMQQSSENLEKGKRKKSAKSQKDAAKKMEEMANQMQMMMQAAMQSRMGEDAQQIAKMLDNLMDISFGLESLNKEISLTSNNDPRFIENTKNLKILRDDYLVLHDSLVALSRRQVMLQQFLVKESDKIKMYFESSLESIQERRKGKTTTNIQYAMTSANNLALMLDESLNSMKQSMSSGKPGEGECKQPGSGESTGMKQLMKMQQGLGKGLKKSGQKPGKGQKPGQDSGGGQSEEMARMAAQQSELRKQMQEMVNQLEGQGGNGNALKKIVEKMEQQEQDIVNKRITSETLERQREIESRLLQAERAMQEREKEERREAVEGKNKERRNPNIDLKYKQTRIDNRNSVINSNPLILSEQYKRVLKKYLYEIESRKKESDRSNDF